MMIATEHCISSAAEFLLKSTNMMEYKKKNIRGQGQLGIVNPVSMITMKSLQYQGTRVAEGSTVTAAEPKESIATTRKND